MDQPVPPRLSLPWIQRIQRISLDPPSPLALTFPSIWDSGWVASLARLAQRSRADAGCPLQAAPCFQRRVLLQERHLAIRTQDEAR